jgi:hypothetical protein
MIISRSNTLEIYRHTKHLTLFITLENLFFNLIIVIFHNGHFLYIIRKQLSLGTYISAAYPVLKS